MAHSDQATNIHNAKHFHGFDATKQQNTETECESERTSKGDNERKKLWIYECLTTDFVIAYM